jgi:hypothetical protein
MRHLTLCLFFEADSRRARFIPQIRWYCELDAEKKRGTSTLLTLEENGDSQM